MKRKPLYSNFISFINTYSIWVALGSLISYLFFSRIYCVNPNYVVGTGLALGIWLIYTLDHLIDGNQLKGKASSERHFKHFQKQKNISYILVGVILILAVLSLWVPSIYYNLIATLLGLTIVHFIINHLVSDQSKKALFLKEVFIAIVVTIGFTVTPWLEVQGEYLHRVIYMFGVLFFVNLANLIIFSLYDRESDKEASILSIAQFYSDQVLKMLILGCLGISSVLVVMAMYFEFISIGAFSTFAAMILTLGLVTLRFDYFIENERYRFWGDFIYVYPLFVLPFL